MLKAAELDSNLFWNIGVIARCYEKKNEFANALLYQQRLLELEPKNAINWIHLAIIQFRVNNHLVAQQALDKSLELAPNDSRIRNGVGWAHLTAKNIESAEQFFVQALNLGYADYPASMNLGHVHLINMNREKAEERYQEAFNKAEDTEKLLKGFEDDYQYLEPQGVTKELYWETINAAWEAAGK